MIKLDTITLPDDLNWIDEFTWSRVSASIARTIGGKPIIEQSQTASMAGRPVTLQNDNAWLSYSNALTLRSWADELNKKMNLTMHSGTVYVVMFRLWEPPAVDWQPVIPYADPESADYGKLTIRLVMV